MESKGREGNLPGFQAPWYEEEKTAVTWEGVRAVGVLREGGQASVKEEGPENAMTPEHTKEGVLGSQLFPLDLAVAFSLQCSRRAVRWQTESSLDCLFCYFLNINKSKVPIKFKILRYYFDVFHMWLWPQVLLQPLQWEASCLFQLREIFFYYFFAYFLLSICSVLPFFYQSFYQMNSRLSLSMSLLNFLYFSSFKCPVVNVGKDRPQHFCQGHWFDLQLWIFGSTAPPLFFCLQSCF